jgi:hypothetical protein
LWRTTEKHSIIGLSFASEEAQKVFVNLESFKAFQAALAGGYREVPSTATNLTLVDSSYDLFS